MLVLRDEAGVQDELQRRLFDARTNTDSLFDLVKPDSLYERPIPERHRIVFYVGHLEAFDWNLLRERVLQGKAFHPEFDQLFAFGIDPVGGGLPSDQPQDWPRLEQVREYVARVRQSVDAGLAGLSVSDENLEDKGPATSVAALLNVAIEHRLMHAETLAYMLHQLPPDRKNRLPRELELVTPPVANEMVEIPAGPATLGLPREGDLFGWDNEFEAYVVNVPTFAVDRYKVTNRQYSAFVAAGGYEDSAYWSAENWAWRTAEDIRHPVFWQRDKERWNLRTMFDEIPLPPDWPVYVSHAEASAYARWAGKSLPREAQWHRAAYGTLDEQERPYPWGAQSPNPKRGNFDFCRWDPTPVNAFPAGQSAFGVHDLVGNGWEWTSTLFAPFNGFRPFSFYPGYSANFFDGKHYVMKGGSARTAGCMLRRSFRNWFQPHYQYVYAGFRCVAN